MVALIGIFAHTASAETVVTANARDGLQISPVLVDMNVDKGRSYSVKVKITNVTKEDLTYYSAVNDFAAKDETGNASVIFGNLLPDGASVRTWISTASSVTVKSGESVTLVATVNVPLNAESGGHYGVLRFSSTPPEEDGGKVSVGASTGMLFLIRVSGEITESAKVASFTTASTVDDKQSSFFEKAPLKFVTRIKHDGNVHLKPTGQIDVYDMFGGVVTTIKVNEVKANVLPDSIRRFDTTLDNGWMFGYYTANVTLGYGTQGQVVTGTTSFWVIPYKIVAVALLVLITLVFILVRIMKVYNKRIIKKAIQKHDKNNSHYTKK
jgi:hypothetical protein